MLSKINKEYTQYLKIVTWQYFKFEPILPNKQKYENFQFV